MTTATKTAVTETVTAAAARIATADSRGDHVAARQIRTELCGWLDTRAGKSTRAIARLLTAHGIA